MSQATLSDNAFAVLSFLAAPAILTNASTILALGTSNRLARAADRARLAATAVLASKHPSDPLAVFQQEDFGLSTRRCALLVKALRRFYLAAGCFAAGTCVALFGAFADYFQLHAFDRVTQVGTILVAVAGVAALVHGAITLVAETHMAIQSLERQHAAVTRWRATMHDPPVVPGA